MESPMTLAANRQSNLYLIFHFINLLGSNRIQVKSVKIKEELQQTKAPLMRSCRGCLGDVPAKAGPLFFFEPLWFGSNYDVASWPCHTGAYPAPPLFFPSASTGPPPQSLWFSFCHHHHHHHHHHRTIFSPSSSPHRFLFIIGCFFLISSLFFFFILFLHSSKLMAFAFADVPLAFANPLRSSPVWWHGKSRCLPSSAIPSGWQL